MFETNPDTKRKIRKHIKKGFGLKEFKIIEVDTDNLIEEIFSIIKRLSWSNSYQIRSELSERHRTFISDEHYYKCLKHLVDDNRINKSTPEDIGSVPHYTVKKENQDAPRQ